MFEHNGWAVAVVTAGTLAATGAFAVVSHSTSPAKSTKSEGAADHRVSESGQSGWKGYNVCFDTNGNPVASSHPSEHFVDGPVVPPMGVGSLRLSTGDGTNYGDCEASFRQSGFNGVKLSDLRTLTYWTNDHTNNGQQFPFLALNVNYAGGSGTDDILFFEPPYQSPGNGGADCAHQAPTAMDTWQGWDALTGCWWSNNSVAGATPGTGTKRLSDIIAAEPNAKIVNASSKVGGVRLAVGEASPSDQFVGYVDSFTIEVKKHINSYDFDPEES